MIKLSLIVPTYNRADILARALPTFLAQDLPSSDYEIVVVDNGSCDHTRRIVEEVMKQADCRWAYVTEPRPGVHLARNKGILLAKGNIVVLGDDDIEASPSWLSSMLEEFDRHPNTGIVGGKVLPIWSGEHVDWIYDYGSEAVHPLFAYLDYGDKRLVLEREYVFSNNMGIRKSLAIQIGGCFPCTFPRSLKHLSGTGENAMIDRVRDRQGDIVYLPEAYVHHHANASRASLDYFIDRYERWAIEEVFGAFRTCGKREATQQLIDRALARLERLEQECLQMRNPSYYRIIMRHWAYQMIRQTCRVLTEPELYEHITKPGYLD